MNVRVDGGKALTTQPSMTLRQLRERFPDEDSCKAFIRDSRWPDGKVSCPRCGNDKVYALKKKPFHWGLASKIEECRKESPSPCHRKG